MRSVVAYGGALIAVTAARLCGLRKKNDNCFCFCLLSFLVLVCELPEHFNQCFCAVHLKHVESILVHSQVVPVPPVCSVQDALYAICGGIWGCTDCSYNSSSVWQKKEKRHLFLLYRPRAFFCSLSVCFVDGVCTRSLRRCAGQPAQPVAGCVSKFSFHASDKFVSVCILAQQATCMSIVGSRSKFEGHLWRGRKTDT